MPQRRLTYLYTNTFVKNERWTKIVSLEGFLKVCFDNRKTTEKALSLNAERILGTSSAVMHPAVPIMRALEVF